ncbi:peroxiredoxin [Deinococcus puniceus]|uniref:thioredoxin-dependent peroxiredoxin n=1 Tax=Deinococcus puniceus TaxID=1182568 RepID=A0A172TB90_9DEIO|nr:peroxiredoxin [Deinococcus puniceus]ANE44187.1 alkyl hydroperoxide reductase [Deinococcus puniceus]
MSLTTGDLVSDFTAQTDQDRPYQFAQHSGSWRVLFFFPRANTTHCQMQARRYQALSGEFAARGVSLLGVSSDTRKQQLMFRDICKVDFPLISDTDHAVSRQFGVLDTLVPGEEVQVARRETFLIDPQGRIAQHWQGVDPATDAAMVLEEVKRTMA